MSAGILHVDMDAFYASVEQRDNPTLKGKPVIVGADPLGRGVVSTCSYEARTFGIRSAMPIKTAYALCPHGVFLPVTMEKYQNVSIEIHKIFHRFTPLVEPISLDEAFLDITSCGRLFGSSVEIARRIQKEINEEINLTASVGISYNKFLAKLASDLEKPKGLVIITENNFREIIWPLGVKKIWGVGYKTKAALEKYNIKTIGDVATLTPEVLQKWFGKLGVQMYQLANGIDQRQVEPGVNRKSYAREETFQKDIQKEEELKGIFMKLSEELGAALREKCLKAKTITVKIREENFQTITRSVSLPAAINNDKDIFNRAWLIFTKNWSGTPLRLVGISLSELNHEKHEQLSLFNDGKEDTISSVVDSIRKKHGWNSIKRGYLEGRR